MKRRSCTLRQVASNRGQEVRFGRFINNDSVTPDRILDRYWKSIKADWSDKHLLVISDTSTLTFDKRADRKVGSQVGMNSSAQGFDIHSVLTMDADDFGIYGAGGIKIITNDFSQAEEDKTARLARRKKVYQLPLCDKESYKWLDTSAQAIERMPRAARYTLVGDREADIYELACEVVARGWDFLYRNRQDRRIVVDGQATTLYKTLDTWSPRHTFELKVQASKHHRAHTASMQVKFGALTLCRPGTTSTSSVPAQLPVYVIEAKEESKSIIGRDKAVHWILWTSHAITTLQEAMQALGWYSARWDIEQSYRALKRKGLRIESSEVETFEALCNLATLSMLCVGLTLQMIRAREGLTAQRADEVFNEQEQACLRYLNSSLEGKTAASCNPYPPRSLAFAAWVVARLGGWKGYAKERPAGPTTMMIGLNRLFDMSRGFEVATALQTALHSHLLTDQKCLRPSVCIP